MFPIALECCVSLQAHVLSNYLPIGYLSCGESHDAVIDLTLDLLHMVKHSSSNYIQTLLLYGPRGVCVSVCVCMCVCVCVHVCVRTSTCYTDHSVHI